MRARSLRPSPIRIVDGTLLVYDDSAIYRNEAHPTVANEGGGCIAAYDSTVRIYGTTQVYDCETDSDTVGLAPSGGALYLVESDVEISGLAVVRDSDSDGDGGLIHVESGLLEVKDNVLLSGGDAGAYGGNISGRNEAEITLRDNVEVRGGRASVGGGIALIGSLYYPKATALGSVRVIDNTALADGGGVYASHARWEQYENSRVGDTKSVANRAMKGAGIFLENDGVAEIGDDFDSGHWVDIDPVSGEPTGCPQVRWNVATVAGGGIYAHEGAWVVGTGMAVYHNKAVGANSGDGGGIAVEGDGSTASLVNSLVSENRARYFGGGVFAHLGGFVAFGALADSQPEASACPMANISGRYCSELRDNEAGRPEDGTTGDGGAIHVGADAQLQMFRTGVIGNRSQISAPSFYVAETGEAVVFSSLVADALIDNDWPATDGVVVRGGLFTFQSTYAGDGATVFYVPNGLSYGDLSGNIFWPDGGVGGGLIRGATNPLVVAGWVFENTGLLSNGGSSTYKNVNPLFVSTARGDYRIDGSSPAFEAPNSAMPADDIELCPRVGSFPDHGAFEVGSCP